MNLTVKLGRLTKDPEFQEIPNSNIKKTSFSIAVNDKFKDNEKTYFFNCEAWNNTAKAIVENFKKGQRILIHGKDVVDNYEKDGVKKTYHKIVVEKFLFIEKKENIEKDIKNINDENVFF